KLQLNVRMMVLLLNTICFCLWFLWCCLLFVQGLCARGEWCQNSCIDKSNISTELQSDVLLPCNFSPSLLGSNKSADIAVVWSQINTTTHHLVEISLQGILSSWDYKGGRIKYFSKPSEPGNFSILLQKVQLYDLSLYQCELFNGTGCIIAYQEIQLGLATFFHQTVIIAAAASAGAVFLCLFIACVFIGTKRKCRQHPESTRDCPYDNPIYASYTVQLSHEKDEALVSENPIYETAWYRRGNFSILLQKVQLYDLSLYQCVLLNGTGCIIAYQEIQLGHKLDESSLQLWITVGALAGVTVLLAVFTACLLHAKRRKNIIMIKIEVDENIVGVVEHTESGSKSIENPIYDTSCQIEANYWSREEE
ncbi:matrix-remodeling-associated protein 8-like isoform X1, partial [Clarias magur]